MRARKGYRALTEAEVALLRRGGSCQLLRPARRPPPARPWKSTGGGGGVALDCAARGPRPRAELAVTCGLDRPVLAWAHTVCGTASEVDEATLRQPEWASKQNGLATLTLADGQRLADVTLKLEPGSRAIEASLDAEIPASTEVVVRLRLSPAGGGLPLSDTLRASRRPATSGRLFRRGPTTGRQFVAAGGSAVPTYRSMRAWPLPIEDAASPIEATLIDRTGAPLRIPVASRVETIDGTAWALGELSLAPLSPGDYVLRVVVGQGAGAATSLTAIRIVS